MKDYYCPHRLKNARRYLRSNRHDILPGDLCKDPHFPNSVILVTEVVLDTTYSDVERYYARYISSNGKGRGTAWVHSLKVLSR